MKGDMHIARSTDQAIAEKAECGGVVGTLLKYALESKTGGWSAGGEGQERQQVRRYPGVDH